MTRTVYLNGDYLPETEAKVSIFDRGFLMADGVLPPPRLPLALVVAPTRELALQVSKELEWLYAKAGARIAIHEARPSALR